MLLHDNDDWPHPERIQSMHDEDDRRALRRIALGLALLLAAVVLASFVAIELAEYGATHTPAEQPVNP